jgi:hypothetical protein
LVNRDKACKQTLRGKNDNTVTVMLFNVLHFAAQSLDQIFGDVQSVTFGNLFSAHN